MKELTPEQIQENWNQLRQLINDTFKDERLEKLNHMYDYFETRMCVAPASGKEHYHNAHVGGYVEHVLHVIDCAVKLKKLWEDGGATINFSDEELIFAAMHHDLGKVGDMKNDYYIPQESEWHRKNQGSIFTHNGELQYMTVTDRAIWLLQHFEIPMSEWEYVGLRLTDGLYEEANKSYYVTYNPDFSLKSNIAYILHQADSMATHIENDKWKSAEQQEEIKVQENVENIKKAVTMEETSEQLSQKSKDLFEELFGDNS
jgi:predicted HD phosphohydrolase